MTKAKEVLNHDYEVTRRITDDSETTNPKLHHF